MALALSRGIHKFFCMKNTKDNYVGTQLSLRDKKRLRIAAAKRGMLMSAAVREALVAWLKGK